MRYDLRRQKYIVRGGASRDTRCYVLAPSAPPPPQKKNNWLLYTYLTLVEAFILFLDLMLMLSHKKFENFSLHG